MNPGLTQWILGCAFGLISGFMLGLDFRKAMAQLKEWRKNKHERQ